MNSYKSFAMFCQFIANVKSGKSCIVFASDYVVIDRKSYERLIQKPENIATIEYWDELGKIDKETWKLLEKKK
jgi:hypothetical protein